MGLREEVRQRDVNRLLALLEKEGVTLDDLKLACDYPGLAKQVGVALRRGILLLEKVYGDSSVEEALSAVAEIDDVGMLKHICLTTTGKVFEAALKKLPRNYAAMVAREHLNGPCVSKALQCVDDYILETWKKNLPVGWYRNLVIVEMEDRERNRQ